MNEASRENTGLIVVLLVMTAATGIVDAVSYLGLGHVFTANKSCITQHEPEARLCL